MCVRIFFWCSQKSTQIGLYLFCFVEECHKCVHACTYSVHIHTITSALFWPILAANSNKTPRKLSRDFMVVHESTCQLHFVRKFYEPAICVCRCVCVWIIARESRCTKAYNWNISKIQSSLFYLPFSLSCPFHGTLYFVVQNQAPRVYTCYLTYNNSRCVCKLLLSVRTLLLYTRLLSSSPPPLLLSNEIKFQEID